MYRRLYTCTCLWAWCYTSSARCSRLAQVRPGSHICVLPLLPQCSVTPAPCSLMPTCCPLLSACCPAQAALPAQCRLRGSIRIKSMIDLCQWALNFFDSRPAFKFCSSRASPNICLSNILVTALYRGILKQLPYWRYIPIIQALASVLWASHACSHCLAIFNSKFG